jgi:hypothetical protein
MDPTQTGAIFHRLTVKLNLLLCDVSSKRNACSVWSLKQKSVANNWLCASNAWPPVARNRQTFTPCHPS